jgi:hypothetical protein
MNTAIKCSGVYDPEDPRDLFTLVKKRNPLPFVPRRATAPVANPHEFSNNMRQLAVCTVAWDMGGNPTYAEGFQVCDLFGSIRDLTQYHRVCPGRKSFSADFGVKYSGDVNKGDRVDVSKLDTWADVVTITDVYHLNPDIVSKAVRASKSGRCYVVTRRFKGYCGADEREGNMVWHRVFDKDSYAGEILAYPDAHNPPYPPHPDSEFLFNPIEGLTGSIVAISGPYYVLRFIASSTPQARVPTSDPDVMYGPRDALWVMENPLLAPLRMGYRAVRNNALVRYVAGDDPCFLFDTKAYYQGMTRFAGRPLTGANQTEIRTWVASEVESRDWAKQFRATPLSSRVDHVISLTCDELFRNVLECAPHLYDMRVANSENERLAREARAQNPPTKVRRVEYSTAAKVFVGVAAAAIAWRYRDSVAGAISRTSGSILQGARRELGRAVCGQVLPTLKDSVVGVLSGAALLAQSATGRSTPGALFREAPLLSAVSETLLFRIDPRMQLVIMGFEYLRYRETSPIHLLLAAVGPGTWTSMGIHLFWNLLTGGRAPTYGWDGHGRRFSFFGFNFLTAPVSKSFGKPVVKGPFSRSLPPSEVRLEPVTPTCPEWNDKVMGTVRVRCEDFDIVVKDRESLNKAYAACLRKSVVRSTHAAYSLLRFDQEVIPSSKTALTTLTAVFRRLLTRPNAIKGVHRDLRSGWSYVTQLERRLGLYRSQSDPRRAVREFVLHETNNVTRARLLEAFDEANRGLPKPLFSKGFVKNNECLGLPDKERLVVNVSPRDQILFVSANTLVCAYLKQLFRPFEAFVGGEVVYIFYCSGLTVGELEAVVNSLATLRNAILVAGDDSLVKLQGHYYCNDFSKFDGSRSPASVAATLERLRAMGLFESEIGAFREATNQRLVAASDGVRFDTRLDSVFPTGILLTTPINGMDNIACMLAAFSRVLVEGESHDEAFSWCGRELGFVLKVHRCSSLERVDFLKGLFTNVQGVYRYLPLPGMIFKLCKMNNDPVAVFGREAGVLSASFPHLTLQQWSYVCMARAISLAWKYVPREYPILGTFLSRCDFIAGEDVLSPNTSYTSCVVEDARYKIQYDRALLEKLDLDSVYDQMSARYGLEVEVLKELDALVASIDSFPWKLEHEAFEQILTVDYR